MACKLQQVLSGLFCGAHGYLHATHSGCFVGEAPTGKRVKLRAGLHWYFEGGKAKDGYFMTDLPALFEQLGAAALLRSVNLGLATCSV